MRTEFVTRPTEEPVSLAEAKLAASIDADITVWDDFVAGLVKTARIVCEASLGQQLVTATRRLWLDRFPRAHKGLIEMPRGPLVSVSSVKYYDADDALQTLDASLYQVDAVGMPGRLLPGLRTCWPATSGRVNGVQIEYVCGYGDAEDVPDNIKTAIKLLVSHWNKNREAVGVVGGPVAFSVEALLGVSCDGNFAAVGDE